MHGSELTKHGVRFCLWAPEHAAVDVVVQSMDASSDQRVIAMNREKGGYHHVIDPLGRAGDQYQFRLGSSAFPDPASQAQVDGVHGPSLVVDSGAFAWTDSGWQRPAFRDLVIYEMHVGTFTPAGTFRGAIEKLAHLREVGVNAVEIMPIGDFPGRWGWGYDGVLIYAPARIYGSPDDLRALIDAAHAHGIAVILDVVYNHFGPDGNYLGQYSRAYFNEAHHTPWGAAFNFDAPGSGDVRNFFVGNPVYWMEQFHVDGFRFDATHAIIDTSRPHILADLTAAIHLRGGYAIAEDSRNEARLLEGSADGGYDFDGIWADDFHHTVRVAQTGLQDAYFQDFDGTLEELITTLQHGWYFRGQFSTSADRKRGTECRHLPPSKFVHCLTNHDQTGNRAFGERPNQVVAPEGYRAASMLLCLTPYTPMLFMGQEWASTTPFLYFTDHKEELGGLITEGRRREFAEFSEFKDRESRERIPDPQSEATFLQSKLDWDEKKQPANEAILRLYRECLRVRQSSEAFRPRSRDSFEAVALDFGVGAIRYAAGADRFLLLFDLVGGHAGSLRKAHSVALPDERGWEVMLSSEEVRFGGNGSALFHPDTGQVEFARAGAVLLRAR